MEYETLWAVFSPRGEEKCNGCVVSCHVGLDVYALVVALARGGFSVTLIFQISQATLSKIAVPVNAVEQHHQLCTRTNNIT